MAEWTPRLEGDGINVEAEPLFLAAALRHFEANSAFTAAVREALGVALPEVQRAHLSADGEFTLAWRGPTETWVLSFDPTRLSELEKQLSPAREGCFVNLSGGLSALRLRGERIADLLSRLGGTGCIPAPGEARRGRLADVPVLATSLRAGETWLIVDRAYAEHLVGWIRETLLDWADS